MIVQLALSLFHPSSLIPCLSSLVRQFAQGDREVAGRAFDPVGVGFEFVRRFGRAYGHGGEGCFRLCAQALGGSVRLLLGIGTLWRLRRWRTSGSTHKNVPAGFVGPRAI